MGTAGYNSGIFPQNSFRIAKLKLKKEFSKRISVKCVDHGIVYILLGFSNKIYKVTLFTEYENILSKIR